MTMTRAIGLILFVLGVGLLLACGVVTWKTDSFIRAAERAPGVVTALNRSSDDYYSPVVRFRTIAGREMMFTSQWRSRPADFQVGEEVEVLCPPGQPDDARIGSFWEQRGASVILGGIGANVLILGALGIVFGRRPWARPAGPRPARETAG